MSMQELSLFDQLKADITVFVSPVKKLTVTDSTSAVKAIEAAKTIKSYLTQLESKRTELVKPLNDRVKLVNGYAKDIEAPLRLAEQHIKAQIGAYEAEQDRIRQTRLREEDEKRREHERKLAEEQAKLEADFRARAEAEAREAAERAEEAKAAAALFGLDEAEPADEAKAIREKAEREAAERQAQAEREAKIRAAEAAQRKAELENGRIKNTKKIWKCELEDISKVPREFQVISLNEQAVLAAARGGLTNIPGVRVWQEMSVTIGAHTGVAEYRKIIP